VFRGLAKYVVLSAFVWAAVWLPAQSTNDLARPTPPDSMYLSQGRYIYQRNCVMCHGKRGDGKGELGQSIVPPPRDFTIADFKFRSIPGALPSDSDLERTISKGVAGSAMPVFQGALTPREIHAVAQYIKDFSPKWKRPEDSIKSNPPKAEARVSKP
jgi:mono/diheme cytochrome c family protein